MSWALKLNAVVSYCIKSFFFSYQTCPHKTCTDWTTCVKNDLTSRTDRYTKELLKFYPNLLEDHTYVEAMVKELLEKKYPERLKALRDWTTLFSLPNYFGAYFPIAVSEPLGASTEKSSSSLSSLSSDVSAKSEN